jgi:hypothetical protein
MPIDPKKRGLASVSPERRREISRLGGKMVQRLRRGHRWTPEECRRYGEQTRQAWLRRAEGALRREMGLGGRHPANDDPDAT